ncbi:MAG: DUF5011 domain-containing protein, partial [Patescibacteria group bacterium]
ANSIRGLEIISNKISSLSNTVDGLSNTESWISKDSFLSLSELVNNLSASSSLNENRIDILGSQINNLVSILGFDGTATTSVREILDNQILKIEDINSRIVYLENNKDLNLNSLSVLEGLSVNGTSTLSGILRVDNIYSIGDLLSILSDTEFLGRLYFNSDTAGFALIKQGDKSVDIVFEREYAEQPIINTSISLDGDESSADNIFNNDIKFTVIKKNLKGFTIILNKPADSDINFGWTAIAVKNPKKFTSVSSVLASLDIITADVSAEVATTTVTNEYPTIIEATTSDDIILPIFDTTAPLITVNGDNPISITEGDLYNDPGAIAIDDVDGEVPVSTSGLVDTFVSGVYNIIYSAVDTSGNTSSAERVVNVNIATTTESSI